MPSRSVGALNRLARGPPRLTSNGSPEAALGDPAGQAGAVGIGRELDGAHVGGVAAAGVGGRPVDGPRRAALLSGEAVGDTGVDAGLVVAGSLRLRSDHRCAASAPS